MTRVGFTEKDIVLQIFEENGGEPQDYLVTTLQVQEKSKCKSPNTGASQAC